MPPFVFLAIVFSALGSHAQPVTSSQKHDNAFEFVAGLADLPHRGSFLLLNPAAIIGLGKIGFAAHFFALLPVALDPEFDTSLYPDLVRYGFGFSTGLDVILARFGRGTLSIEPGFGIQVWEDDVSVGLPVYLRWTTPLHKGLGFSASLLYQPLIDLNKGRMGNELAAAAGVRIVL